MNKKLVKGLLITIGIWCAVLGSLSLLTGCEYDNVKEVEGTDFEEWVSPDGVHYWVYAFDTRQGLMSPRYDSNGNVVVDKENK